MKGFIAALPLVATTTAFVFPDPHVFAQLPIQNEDHIEVKPVHHSWSNKPRTRWNRIWKSTWKSTYHKLPKTLDDILDLGGDRPDHGDHPHHPPGPPHHHPPPDHDGPHHPRPPPPGRRPGRRPHRGGRHGDHGHHKPNHTIYELISKSKYTTNFTKLIDEFEDVVELLNSTKANHTVFAPTNFAFDKLPEHLPKVPKEFIKKVLLYHILPDVHSSWKLLFEHTAPTLFKPDSLKGNPQRVRISWSLLKGVTVNFFGKVVAKNIPATNGLIHGVDSILVPPPPGLAILSHLPGTFSTLELGLRRTDLWEKIHGIPKDAIGGTLFAPSNIAFQKLGPRANAFLFSKYGEKYLKALLEYHVVQGKALYSTAFYDGDKEDDGKSLFNPFEAGNCHDHEVKTKAYPHVHVDLPTLLDGKHLAIDIFRKGPFVDIKVNAYVSVAFQDVLAREGVIQVVNTVIIPPKTPGAKTEEEKGYWKSDGEITVEELVERLRPYVVEDKKGCHEKVTENVQEMLIEQNLEL